MRRRMILGSVGATLPVALAGCGDLTESIDGDERSESNETEGNDTEEGDDDGPDGEPSDADSEAQGHEDESVTGEVIISEAASESLSARRHTFTWEDDPPGDECNVHVELENDGDEEVVVDMEARIYDEDGAELASTHSADEASPEPGETGVYSVPLSNCEGAATYEFEITGADDEDGASEESEDSNTVLIDDFEEYGGGELVFSWTVDGTGEAEVTPDAALGEDSSQGLRQDETSEIRSFPGQGLENYPEDGREVSILMRPDSSTQQPWILVGLEDDEWHSETDNWRLELHMNSGIRIVRDEGSRDVLAKDSRYEFNAGDVYDLRFTFDSDDGVEFYVLDESDTVVARVSTSETTGIDDEMSLGLRTAQGVDWDTIRLVDAE